ncbi:MAG: hypothetical protein FWD56_08090, partial [Bacteroidales bacterium]|nr:hypothetical protein [Bacteroidales bacterium]
MKNITTLFVLLCLWTGCTKEFIPADIVSRPKTQFGTLPNPYTLANMQAVFDSLSLTKATLQPTDYYVRFLPQDSLQLFDLMYHYGLELFDYPLDIDLGEGEVYEDPTIPEDGFMWQYTTVKPDFIFPAGIYYEILEECYIPPANETIPLTRSGGLCYLEDAAFERLGYKIEPPLQPQTRAGVKQSGQVSVLDNCLEKIQYVPIKGVKIRCNTIVKWATAYTDENGYYTMDGNFSIWPHYAIVFDNHKGFDIWDGWIHITKATYHMGCHSRNGQSRSIFAGSAWRWAAVNNAAYEYYQMCEATGITKPPANLKIWVINSLGSSAAAMLSQIKDPIGLNGNSPWLNLLVNNTAGILANTLLPLLKNVILDIAIGTQNRSYRRIYGVTHHELAHASHFSEAGSAFWADYISYIITYGAYGDGKGKNAEMCGVGEMWGFAMERIQECEKYEPGRLDSLYSANWDNNHWFKQEIFWDLYRKNILTKKQIFDCLSPDVDTYSKLID